LTFTKEEALFRYCLKLADDRLILGHRLSELCGHGPILEEDIATTNISLDLIGQANYFLEYCAELEAKGRTADDLAFLRNEKEFVNVLLTEQDNTDFAYTIVKQFIFDNFAFLQMKSLCDSTDEKLSALAKRAIKEITYHLRHSSMWVIRLGDGTTESKERITEALDFLWMYAGELFEQDEYDKFLIESGIVTDINSIKSEFLSNVNQVLIEATLPQVSLDIYMQTGGRNGKHSENMGHLLAELQFLQRAYPKAEW
jgi:ring-1,2-phenylacetyl-CoA epoxidase subunit PaaC